MSDPDVRPSPILFYDGECGLCARVVRWVAKRDRRRRFWFAPLQGSTFRELNGEARGQGGPATDLSTMVVFDAGSLHRESDAALVVASTIGGVWGLVARLARWCPRGVRDRTYRFIARRRHRWFRAADACSIARPGSRDRFLP